MSCQSYARSYQIKCCLFVHLQITPHYVCMYDPHKGGLPNPVTGSPSRKTMGSKSAISVRRLSTISEQDPDKLDTDSSSHDPRGGGEWGGSSFSMCSDKFKNSSSHFSSVLTSFVLLCCCTFLWTCPWKKIVQTKYQHLQINAFLSFLVYNMHKTNAFQL